MLLIDSMLSVGELFIVTNWNDSLAVVFPEYCGLITGQDPVNEDILIIATGGGNSFYSSGEFGNSNIYINDIQSLNFTPFYRYKRINARKSPASVQNNLQFGRDRAQTARHWKGDIAEIIIYDSPLNSTQRLQVQQYLSNKFSPPVNLGPDIFATSICPLTLRAKKDWFVSYSWNTGANTDSISVTKNGTYIVTVTDIFGRISTDTVNVNFPFQQLTGPNSFCFGDSIIWNTQLSSSMYTFQWNDFSNDSLLIIANQGNYYVHVTEIPTSCQLFSDTVAVLVDTFPLIASLGPDTTLCAGNGIALVHGQNQATSYLWSDLSTGSSLIINTTGVYYVDVLNANGCLATDTISVLITGLAPSVDFASSDVCFGMGTQFINLSSSSDSIISWNWDFGDSVFDTIQNPIHSYSSPGQFIASLTVSTDAGCSASKLKAITVHSYPFGLFSFPSTICNREPAQFFDNSLAYSDTIVSWSWSFGNGFTDTIPNPIVSYESIGDYIVDLTVTNQAGCATLVSRFITIRDSSYCFLPNQLSNLELWIEAGSGVTQVNRKVSEWRDQSSNSFKALQIDSAFSPSLIDSIPKLNYKKVVRFDGVNDLLKIDSAVTIGEIYILANWNDSLAILFPEYSGLITGQDPVNEDILLIATGGSSTLFMSGEFAANIFINSNLSANFSPLYDYKIINGRTPSISNQDNLQIGRDRLQSLRQWKGDVAEIVIFNSLLSFTERQQLEKYFRLKYAPPVNLGSDIVMNSLCDTLIDASPRFKSYRWYHENTLLMSETNQDLLVSKSGKYWVEVTDVFGFISADTINIAYPVHQPQQNILACFGDTIHWNTNLYTNDYTFLWSDNSTDSTLGLVDDGLYYVTIIENATNCIFISDTVSLTVDSFPLIASLGNDSVSLCVGNTISLVQGVAQATTYLWSTGDTTASIQILVSGNYSLFVADYNGCTKTDSIYATIVGNPPVADFSSTSGCLGTATQFLDSSYDSAVGNSIVSWHWNFGDATSDTIRNPSHTFLTSGNHVVVLTVYSNLGCNDHDTSVIFVHHIPSASFINDRPCTVNNLQFNSISTIAAGDTINGWSWNFGNPSSGNNSSALQHPTHRYDTTGNYVVSLITTTTAGCSDTAFTVLQVKQASRALFQYLPTCFGSLVQFSNFSTPPLLDTAWLWNFGDNTGQSPFENPAHYYAFAQTYNVTLSVVASTGCVSTATLPVTVSPIPVANFVRSTACVNTPYQFIDSSYIASGSITKWNWNIGGLKTDTLRNTSYTFSDTGYYSIVLTVTSEIGCSKTMTRIIYVNPKPLVNFGFTPQFGNPPLLVSFNNLTSNLNSNTYNWSFGDGANSTLIHPQHQYNDTNLYSIKLVATSSAGCKDSATRSIFVNQPVLDLAIANLSSSYISNNHLFLKVDLANLGTRTINNFKLEARLEEGTTIQESFTMSLPTGYSGQITLAVSLDLGSGQSKYYCVRAVEPNGTTDDFTGNDEKCKTFSNDFSVPNPYPNPFNDKVMLQMILPYKGAISIEIIDLIGKQQFLHESMGQEGLNQYEADLEYLSNGPYGFRFRFNDIEIMKTILKIELKK